MRALPLICAGVTVVMGAALLLSGCGTPSAATPPNPAPPMAAAPSAPADQRQVPTYDITQVALMPKFKTRVAPVYPPELRQQGVTGEVIVDFIVDERGKPFGIQVTHATHPAFGAAAAESVANSTFTPGMMDGQPVRTHMQLPMVFKLNGP